MANFDNIINNINNIENAPENIENTLKTVEKINITELFDSNLISTLFIDVIDSIIVGGLMLYAKQKNVNVTAKELKLNSEQKAENVELINNIVEKIKINEKAVGSLLISFAIISKYFNSFKLIKNKKNEDFETNNKDIQDIKNSETNNNNTKNIADVSTIEQIKKQSQNENKGIIKKAGRPKGSKNKPGHKAGRPKKSI